MKLIQPIGKIDAQPLLLTVKAQGEFWGENSTIDLWKAGEAEGLWFAFPQVRGLVLGMAARAESERILKVFLIKTEPGEKTDLGTCEEDFSSLMVMMLDSFPGTLLIADEDTYDPEAGEVVWLAPQTTGALFANGQDTAFALAVWVKRLP